MGTIHFIDRAIGIIADETEATQECLDTDSPLNGAYLPADVWFSVAQIYLWDSPGTVAALSSTNRQFHNLLHFLKFRAVYIRLNDASKRSGSSSPALRFAKLLRDDPAIIDHVGGLWVGHEGDINLRAVNGHFAEDSERVSLCYILSRTYGVLRHLAFSFQDTTNLNLPATVLHAMLSSLSTPSLYEVSLFMGIVPWIIYSQLQSSHIDALNIRSVMANPAGMTSPLKGWQDFAQNVRALTVDLSDGLDILLQGLLNELPAAVHLSSYVLKAKALEAAFYLPRGSCSSVINPKLYLTSWQKSEFFGIVKLCMKLNPIKRLCEARSPTLVFSI